MGRVFMGMPEAGRRVWLTFKAAKLLEARVSPGRDKKYARIFLPHLETARLASNLSYRKMSICSAKRSVNVGGSLIVRMSYGQRKGLTKSVLLRGAELTRNASAEATMITGRRSKTLGKAMLTAVD
jgi:hypothetical protein